ncbi:hypothetical protein D3C78_1549270 [compost metagenome]
MSRGATSHVRNAEGRRAITAIDVPKHREGVWVFRTHIQGTVTLHESLRENREDPELHVANHGDTADSFDLRGGQTTHEIATFGDTIVNVKLLGGGVVNHGTVIQH